MPVNNTTKRDDYVRRIQRELARHGIDDFHFVRRSRHRAVIVKRGGRVVTVIFPSSGSDIRGPANTVGNLRRALGLIGGATR
jgi:hypothetical protein